MPITLGTNIASLRGQRQLAKSSSQLSSVFERLSSGQRINRASDDAAGLAIADSLRADSRQLAVAARNINDGISLLNIADAALEAQSGILTRMQELAEQAANGIYSEDQRLALDTEYKTLIDEFDRIGRTTEFNGRSLLQGDQLSFSIQVGTDSQETSILSAELNESTTGIGTIHAFGNYDSNVGVGGSDLTAYADFTSLIVTQEQLFEFYGSSAQTETVTDSNGDNRETISFLALAGFSNDPNDPGIYTTYYQRQDGLYQIAGSTPVPDTAGTRTFSVSLTFADTGTTGTINGDLNGYDIFAVDAAGFEATTVETAIEFSGLETQSRAQAALEVAGNRADVISTLRGEIGATQSRLDTALSVTQVTNENLQASESRIRDADIASETANLVRLNILQQAAASVLSQANLQPQLALQLLRGGI